MTTSDNLKAAFAGESQANRKYLAFAKKAQAEGKPGIAKLFRAAADAETVHALAHLNVLAGVKGTADNLKAAIAGEGEEFQQMYPQFVAQAQSEQQPQALRSFSNALAVEKIHYQLYTQALQDYQAGRDFAAPRIFVCQVCGNTVTGEAPDTCEICGNPKKGFAEIQ